MLPLTDKDSATSVPLGKEVLVPSTKKFIKPGSTICSDSWHAYNSLNDEGYRHWCVNHNINFVSPENKDFHTQNMERL